MQDSSLQQALADTRVPSEPTTDGYWADALAQLYGFPRPPRWPQAPWMRAVHKVAYGRRDTFGVLLDCLEMVFGMWTDLLVKEGLTVEQGPYRLLGEEGDFDCFWEHRWIRVGDYRFQSSYASENGATLFLVGQPVLATDVPPESLVGEEDVSATLLPFWVDEDYVKGLVTVQIDSDILGFPGSYLFPPGERDEPLEGIGGILMPDGTVGAGDVPAIYLAGTGAARALQVALNLIVPAGIKVEVISRVWCEESPDLPGLP